MLEGNSPLTEAATGCLHTPLLLPPPLTSPDAELVCKRLSWTPWLTHLRSILRRGWVASVAPALLPGPALVLGGQAVLVGERWGRVVVEEAWR